MPAAGQVSSTCPAVETGWIMAVFLLNGISFRWAGANRTWGRGWALQFLTTGTGEKQSLSVPRANPWQPALGSLSECVTATLEWNMFRFSEEKIIKMSAKASVYDILSFGVYYLLKVGCNVLLLRWWSLGRDEPLDLDSFPCKYHVVPVTTGPAEQLVWRYCILCALVGKHKFS